MESRKGRRRSARIERSSDEEAEQRRGEDNAVEQLRREMAEAKARAEALETLVRRSLEKRKKRKRKRKTPSSSTDSSTSSSSSSDSTDKSSDSESSGSESESHSKARRRRKRKKRTRRTQSKKIKSKKRWKSTAYRAQFRENDKIDGMIRDILSCKGLPCRAAKAARKARKALTDRQKWLMVADEHGVAVAERFGGSAEEALESKQELSRLQQAIDAEDRLRALKAKGAQITPQNQPFRRRGSGEQQVRTWTPGSAARQQPSARVGPRPEGAQEQRCFTCGGAGHFQRNCPNTSARRL